MPIVNLSIKTINNLKVFIWNASIVVVEERRDVVSFTDNKWLTDIQSILIPQPFYQDISHLTLNQVISEIHHHKQWQSMTDQLARSPALKGQTIPGLPAGWLSR